MSRIIICITQNIKKIVYLNFDLKELYILLKKLYMLFKKNTHYRFYLGIFF